MKRIVPHEQFFNRAKSFDIWSSRLVYFSSLTSVVLIFISSSDKNISIFLTAINCVCIAIIVILEVLYNYFFFEAGKVKRLDFIDNSLDTNYSGEKSQGYFSNENITSGLYKMAVNCFENSFFSSRISSKMIRESWIKFITIVVIFIFSASIGQQELINLLFQISLPILLFQQALKITLFHNRVNYVYKNFLQLFNNFKKQGHNHLNDAEILKIVLDYQTILAWGSIMLSDKIFKKDNDILSKKWIEIKNNYDIQ